MTIQVKRPPLLRAGRFFSLEVLKQGGGGGAAAEGGDGAGPAAAAGGGQHLVRLRLKPTAEDATALLKSEHVGDPHALALVARARGLLWGEADAVKFMERIVKKEKVLLELMKHKFPELHKRLRVTIVPTEAQAGSASTAASEVLPRLPEGGLMELNAGVAFQGGAEEARPAPAPRP